MTTPTAPPLRLRGVRKTYRTPDGPLLAVDGVDLDVAAGEIVAFLGPNGAGKTTTLDMVLGLVPPTAGTVEVFGGAPRQAVDRGWVSAVLQTGGLLRDLSVADTVRAIASLHRVPERVDTVLAATGLADLAGRKVGACSGGEQQRLRFALSLLPDPQLLVLDEPTAGMDVNARRAFWDTMREETRGGRTVLFATHYLEEAEAFAPRTVLIGKGRVLADGPTERLRGTVGGRSVTATVPDPQGAVAALRALPGVDGVTVDGHRVSVVAPDSDAVALLLLTDLGGRDLEVSAPSLEQAFVALTEGTEEGTA